ncbi:hypothetical protein KIL84_001430 [Mauremys mutica]|uniref:Uncharacterized protein n=1 Tax=Mauremys mutica TaxID=74926 RepID=A0A9D4AVU7_9SAUR|nr:hypothetical protein KIL84_001430 [Mauremys mutica]
MQLGIKLYTEPGIAYSVGDQNTFSYLGAENCTAQFTHSGNVAAQSFCCFEVDSSNSSLALLPFIPSGCQSHLGAEFGQPNSFMWGETVFPPKKGRAVCWT